MTKKIEISSEAYAANKEWIKKIISDHRGSPSSSRSLLEVGSLEAIRAQGRGITALQNDEQNLVRTSATSPDDFEALCYGAANYLALGRELSPLLRSWIADYLMGRVSRPAKKVGTKRKTGVKILIPHLIELLVTKGMSATRSKSSSPCSACDVVADAFKESKLSPSSYGYIEGIWGKRETSENALAGAVYWYTPQ